MMKKIFLLTLNTLLVFVLISCNMGLDTDGERTVEFVIDGDMMLETISVAYGETIIEPENPTYLDYTFGGWFQDTRHTRPWNFDTDTVTNNMKLYARWTTTVTQTISVQTGTDSSNTPIFGKEVKETTMRVNPRVVVTFALEVVDILDYVGFESTGITYFGLPKSNLPERLNIYSNNIYPNTGTLFEPNYDTLDLMMPDLIILGGRSANLYPTLKTRYPNTDILDVSNNNFSFTVQSEVFNNLGLIFPGIKTPLQAALTDITTRLEALQAKVSGQNALFLQVNGDQISVFGVGSRYGVIYNEFQFLASDPNLQTLEAHGNVVSFEYVSEVNPQIIFLMDRAAAIGSSGSTDQIIENALVKNTIAGQNNAIFIVDPISWYILPGGITSTLQMIEDMEQVFNN